MSSLLKENNYCDYFNHVDTECKEIITPYINSVERALLEKHNNSTHYQIPFVIQSILSAYFCDHLHHRLLLKHKFIKWPSKYHFILDYNRGLCQQCDNWMCCSSIQRIKCILNNFQYYLQSQSYSKHQIAPYVTYKYYEIDEILADIQHINAVHPQNSIKFYIRNSIICKMEKSDKECCQHKRDWDEDTSDLEANLNIIHQQFVHHSLAKQQFETAANYILQHNENPLPVLGVLRSCSKKLLKKDAKYRTLDTTNPRVQERLMGFDGVLHFLSLLGFESNAIGTSLKCVHNPSVHVIKCAITVIDSFIAERQPPIAPVNGVQNGNGRNGIVRWFGRMKEKGKRMKMRLK